MIERVNKLSKGPKGWWMGFVISPIHKDAFLLFSQIASGLILLGISDPKGMPLYLTTNEPYSLHSLLWLFKYTLAQVSKTIWKCNYHVFHLHKYIRDGFIYVRRYIIHVLFFSPWNLPFFSRHFWGKKGYAIFSVTVHQREPGENVHIPKSTFLTGLG